MHQHQLDPKQDEKKRTPRRRAATGSPAAGVEMSQRPGAESPGQLLLSLQTCRGNRCVQRVVNATREGGGAAHQGSVGLPVVGASVSSSAPIQRKAVAVPKGAAPGKAASSPAFIPPDLTRRFAQSLDTPFDELRVVRDSQEAVDHQAAAFTRGMEIHFAPGYFRPDLRDGQELIGHELVHVAQQRRGLASAAGKLAGGAPLNDDAQLEGQADLLSHHILNPASQAHPTAHLPSPAHSPVQYKIVRVPKGQPVPATWKYQRSTKTEDIYDDGQPEPEVAALATTRAAVDQMDMDELSDIEQSETELDINSKTGPKKVYRVGNLRDSAKMVHQVMKPNPDETFGVRVGGPGGHIFRLKGRGTQFTVQTTTQKALVQSDATQGVGHMPERGPGDPTAQGSVGSYEHVVSELRAHGSQAVAQAVYNKYINKIPYPAIFSERAQAKMNEFFVILTLAETYRTPYAFALFTASIQAVLNGESLETVYYKGKGQLEALHAGASSLSNSGVSGQLMEQNLGYGENRAHPTQPSMNLSPFVWKGGLERTTELFNKAAPGGDPGAMLETHMLTPMGFGAARLDIQPANVTATRSPGNWGDAVIKVTGINLSVGQKVKYGGVDYVVKSMPPSGWVILQLG